MYDPGYYLFPLKISAKSTSSTDLLCEGVTNPMHTNLCFSKISVIKILCTVIIYSNLSEKIEKKILGSLEVVVIIVTTIL